MSAAVLAGERTTAAGGPRRVGRALLATAGALVYLPMLAGLVVGLEFGGSLGPRPALDAGDLLRHNLTVGVGTALGGVLSFGVATVLAGAWSGAVNGYQLGVVAHERGWGELLSGLPHFVPETLAFACFTAVGLSTGIRVAAHLLPRLAESRGPALRRAGLLSIVGAGLLGLAAVLEAATA